MRLAAGKLIEQVHPEFLPGQIALSGEITRNDCVSWVTFPWRALHGVNHCAWPHMPDIRILICMGSSATNCGLTAAFFHLLNQCSHISGKRRFVFGSVYNQPGGMQAQPVQKRAFFSFIAPPISLNRRKVYAFFAVGTCIFSVKRIAYNGKSQGRNMYPYLVSSACFRPGFYNTVIPCGKEQGKTGVRCFAPVLINYCQMFFIAIGH